MTHLIETAKIQKTYSFGSDYSGWKDSTLVCDKIISETDTTGEKDGFGGNLGFLTVIFLDNQKVYKMVAKGGFATPQCVNYLDDPEIVELREYPSSFSLQEENDEN